MDFKNQIIFLGQANKLGSRIGISHQTFQKIFILAKEKMSTIFIFLIICCLITIIIFTI
jgi:hypothetical protein